MKRTICLLTFIFLAGFCFAQSKVPAVTDDEIAAQIQKAIPKLKRDISDKIMNPMAKSLYAEFAVDTFRIEYYARKKLAIEAHLTFGGMNKVVKLSTLRYQALMAKYIKLLTSKLSTKDKVSFMQAQQAWLTFRDKELAWQSQGTDYKDNYDLEYLRMIKQRTISVFFYCRELPEYR